MDIKVVKSERRQMAELSEDQLETLEKMCKVCDPRYYIEEVNYETGIISIGYVHNPDTSHEWKESGFIEVSVGSDSAMAIFKDVYDTVYQRSL